MPTSASASTTVERVSEKNEHDYVDTSGHSRVGKDADQQFRASAMRRQAGGAHISRVMRKTPIFPHEDCGAMLTRRSPCCKCADVHGSCAVSSRHSPVGVPLVLASPEPQGESRAISCHLPVFKIVAAGNFVVSV